MIRALLLYSVLSVGSAWGQTYVTPSFHEKYELICPGNTKEEWTRWQTLHPDACGCSNRDGNGGSSWTGPACNGGGQYNLVQSPERSLPVYPIPFEDRLLDLPDQTRSA